jgi:hypothetical protein
MARLLRAGKIDDACAILWSHILIINDSLHTFPLSPPKGPRKGQSSTRDCAEVFSQSRRGDSEPLGDGADRAGAGRRSGHPRSTAPR